MRRSIHILAILFLGLAASSVAQTLTIYSGRNEAFVGPVIVAFEAATGMDVEVRYGDTAPLVAQLLEEGSNSPADLLLAQDAGALGAMAAAGMLAPLPREILSQVDARFRSSQGLWVGVTGRARVLVVGPDLDDLPTSVFELTEERFRGRVGWAPGNGSFQAFVTAMRVIYGEARASEWLRAMVANDTRAYPKNTPIVEAVGRGEIDIGLVNHYYLYRFTAENPDFSGRNLFLPDADIGALVNVAGAAVVASSDRQIAAQHFIAFLLSPLAQRHFAAEVNEYPLVPGVSANPELPPLSQLATPDIDLAALSDLETTLELLLDTGALE